VFYDKGNYSEGWRYLEAAPVYTEFTANWADAISKCKTIKANGIDGWRLPTKVELNFMYQNLKTKKIGGFENGWYWSSSENNSNYAWCQSFSNGEQNGGWSPGDKGRAYSIRPVRQF
jgi:hypothetical protein